VHVVDQGQYLGSMTEDAPDPPANAGRRFDADAYRILTRYLKPGLRSVRPLATGPRGAGYRAHDATDV
jgi:hypothetical protein